MSPQEQDQLALHRACNGNAEAMSWLNLWREYVHAIDDIEDEETTSEFRLRTYILALELFTHSFFKAHEQRLKQVVLCVTNSYADAVQWEKASQSWQREWSDHNRHAGAEMVIAVAQLTGGYDHARGISLELRTVCWLEHHDQDGKPI